MSPETFKLHLEIAKTLAEIEDPKRAQAPKAVLRSEPLRSADRGAGERGKQR